MAFPKVVGLTGGIAAGKSAVSKCLARHGGKVVDADLVAREIVEPGQPAYTDIVAQFGETILSYAPERPIDRKALAAVVYADAAKRALLNSITHPRIFAASRARFAELFELGYAVVFYEAALLVENGMHRNLDGLIVVVTTAEMQLQRVMARDGLSLADAKARIAAQMPQAEKAKAATWLIDNSGTHEALAEQVDAVVAAINVTLGPIAGASDQLLRV